MKEQQTQAILRNHIACRLQEDTDTGVRVRNGSRNQVNEASPRGLVSYLHGLRTVESDSMNDLYKAILALPEQLSTVIVLRYMLGYSRENRVSERFSTATDRVTLVVCETHEAPVPLG
ncbi:hypothetical protein [Streptomyces sp. NPDC088812]|uniref:hypothetical protein n=1 Tax=Streptomyces sp. NPDC088812 TaxID=3365905 RepID=UPI0038299DB0